MKNSGGQAQTGARKVVIVVEDERAIGEIGGPDHCQIVIDHQHLAVYVEAADMMVEPRQNRRVQPIPVLAVDSA